MFAPDPEIAIPVGIVVGNLLDEIIALAGFYILVNELRECRVVISSYVQ
jgi:hypothetical protein